MPKIKTKKVASKRFKITKNGKVLHRKQGLRHLRRNKSQALKRRQDKPMEMKNTKFARKLTRLIKG